MLMSLELVELLVFVLLLVIALLLFFNLSRYRQQQTKKMMLDTYDLILDQVDAYIYLKDTQCKYIYANQLTLDYFGVTLEKLKGTSDSDYFPENVVDVLHVNDTKVLNSQSKISDDVIVDTQTSLVVYHEVKQPLYNHKGLLIGLIGVSTDITAAYHLRSKLEQLANTDSLTGLFNRRSFTSFCEHEFFRATRYFQPFSLMIIDIDLFKVVNDTYGHLVGDEVIKRVANICNEHVREADVLARIGGEEFAILLPDTDMNSAYVLAERLREAQQQYDKPQAPSITISIGIATLRSQDKAFSEIFNRADKALYSSKHVGRNSVNVS
ncbi:GGDEF domain-containing protein [Shewanella polaris]|uniref:diguanylate cyclase n=2 Tax=Shewanellaceae TaxID=267890 RepID=A0A4Y5YIA4_9GAMM|nr:GGDEF domain-containing protein [Shewanella polaris]